MTKKSGGTGSAGLQKRPTLIKKPPVPLRKFIGSMADEEKRLAGLDLRRRGKK